MFWIWVLAVTAETTLTFLPCIFFSSVQFKSLFVVICYVFLPAFQCCAHPKAGQNTFFSRFHHFLFISKLYQWFHSWNQQKTSEKVQKNVFLSEKGLKWTKKVENGWKKLFQPAFRGALPPKAGQKHNSYLAYPKDIYKNNIPPSMFISFQICGVKMTAAH